MSRSEMRATGVAEDLPHADGQKGQHIDRQPSRVNAETLTIAEIVTR